MEYYKRISFITGVLLFGNILCMGGESDNQWTDEQDFAPPPPPHASQRKLSGNVDNIRGRNNQYHGRRNFGGLYNQDNGFNNRRGNNKFIRNFPRLKKLLDSLTEEEKEKLKKLRTENPKEFRKFIREKIRSFRKKRLEEDKDVSQLIKKYRNASSDKEKEAIKTRLREVLTKKFDAILEKQAKGLQKIEQKLKELKSKYEKRKQYKEKIIENKLNKLLQDPDLQW